MLIKETTKYTKWNIDVYYTIDYTNKKISIVDHQWWQKKYLFNDRTIDYMNLWLNILDTIKEAVQEAKEKLQVRIDKEKEEMVEKAMELNWILEKLD